MKRLLLCLALLCSFAFGQGTTTLNQPGPFRFARNIAWGSTVSGNAGVAGLQIGWQPTVGSNYSCVTIANNNPTNSSNISVFGFATQDASATLASIYTSPNRWYNTFGIQASGTAVIAANSAAALSLPVNGSAQVAFGINGVAHAGNPDTFDFLEVDSPTPCQQNPYSNITGGVPRTACSQTFQGSAATGTQIVISNSPSGALGGGQTVSFQPRWHVCAYSITGAAGATSAKVAIQVGNTNNTCAAALTPTNGWALTAPVGVPNYSLANAPEIFTLNGGAGVGANGLALCYSDGGTTTGTTITISYDYY